MRKIFFLLLVVTAIGSFISGCNGSKSGGDAVTLKFNLEKGKNYVYGMKSHFDMDAEMMGQKIKSGGDIDFGFKMNVEEVDAAGNRTVACTYDAIKFKINAMGMDMGYDSKNVGDTTKENMMNGMFRKLFGSMVGKSFKMTWTPKGEITKIEGLKEMVTAMGQSMDMPEEMRGQMEKQMEQSFSEDQIKQSFSQGFSIYPENPVKVGDSWNKTMSRNVNNMKMDIDVKYTVKDIKADAVILNMEGKIKGNGETGSSAMKMDISGSQKGTMEIELTSGMPKTGNIDMDMKIAAGQMPKPMDMKMTIVIDGKQN